MGKPSSRRIFRNIKRSVAKIIDLVLVVIEFRRNSDSKLIDPPKSINGNDLAILATYNVGIDEVSGIIKALESAGYEVIIVNNIDSPESLMTGFESAKVLNRNNYGFDIGAYRDALQLVSEPRNLLMLNTSLIWDTEELGKIVTGLRKADRINIVTYLTESLQGERHGQSFFIHLCLDKSNLIDFKRFMKFNTKNWRYKRSAVKYGEKSIFSHFERSKKIEVAFLFPYEFVARSYLNLGSELTEQWIKGLIESGVALNPTQHLWPSLSALRFPGYKKTLISKNPAKLKKIPSMELF